MTGIPQRHLETLKRLEKLAQIELKMTTSSGPKAYWTESRDALLHAIQTIEDRDELLTACKAFVEAYEKCLQLEKTDVALRLCRAAIEKAERGSDDHTEW